jgi:hypothetical protein
VSSIDGRKVQWGDHKDWQGLVIGDSHIDGFVRVHWETPKPQISTHRIEHLTVLDAPPTQEELAHQYYGLDQQGNPIPHTGAGEK